MVLLTISISSRAQMTVENVVSSGGITVLSAASPSFDETAAKLLPGELFESARPVLSRAIIIVNNSHRYVWRFTVIYTFPDQLSGAKTPYKTTISLGATGNSTRSQMLAPGQMALVTPVPGLYSASRVGESAGRLPQDGDQLRAAVTAHLTRHPLSSHVKAVLDSIIFEDGSIIGPDYANTGATIKSQMQAEQDLLNALKGLSGNDLVVKLRQLSATTGFSDYSKQTREEASFLALILEGHGEPTFTAQTERLRQSSWFVNGGTIRRSTE